MGLRDIVILAILITLIPSSLIRPWIGVLAWSWLSYMNPHKLSWTLASLPVAMAIGGATIFGLFFAKDRRSIPWTRGMIIIAIFIIYFTITTIFAWYPEEAYEEWNRDEKVFLFTFITAMMIYGRYRIRALCLVIVGSLGFYGVKGGIFTIVTGGHNRVLGPPDSFFGDNNEMGLVLLMILPLALFMAREESNKWIRLALFATFWLSIPAILGTYSRGALVGLVVVMFVIFWQYRRQLFTVVLIAPLVFTFGKNLMPQEWVARQQTTTSYEKDRSSMQRIQAWGVAFNVAKDRPFLGAGMRFYNGDVERWLSYANFIGNWKRKAKAAHSIYFQTMGDHGFIVFFLFVLLLWGTIFQLGKLSKLEYPPEMAWIRTYAKAIQISLVGYGVSGAFLSLAYFDLFYTWVAVSAILQKEVDEWQRGKIDIARKNSINRFERKPYSMNRRNQLRLKKQ